MRATPGIRVPGAADGFELAVRAILGQQVSVRAARTFAGRIAVASGTRLERPLDGISHLFPTAEQLAGSSLGPIGLTTARAATLQRVAELVASGELDLSGTADREATTEQLLAVPGIGPWTAAYIAMRALRDPDAFPVGDLGVRLGFEALRVALHTCRHDRVRRALASVARVRRHASVARWAQRLSAPHRMT